MSLRPEVLEVDLGPGVRAGFTTRSGGTSSGDWSALNLARHVGDDPDRVRANRELLAAALAAGPVAYLTQVHGADVVRRAGGELAEEEPEEPEEPTADAQVSDAAGAPLAVLVADCVPVLLADAGRGVLATAHAGRTGLAAGVLQATVAAMAGLGARVERIRVAVGPSIGACCYEVPASLRDEVAAVVPQSAARTRAGTPALDLPAGVVAVLRDLGVRAVETVGICTAEDDRFYSYRRSGGAAGATGRFAGVVVRG